MRIDSPAAMPQSDVHTTRPIGRLYGALPPPLAVYRALASVTLATIFKFSPKLIRLLGCLPQKIFLNFRAKAYAPHPFSLDRQRRPAVGPGRRPCAAMLALFSSR